MDSAKRKEQRTAEEEIEHDAADDLVDAGSEYSFPASDPPSYMGGAAVAGPPPQKGCREAAVTVPTAPEEVKPAGSAPAKRGRPPSNGVTIAAKTDEFNKKVPALKKAGATWAKVHSSFFGSHTAADAQNKRADDYLKKNA